MPCVPARKQLGVGVDREFRDGLGAGVAAGPFGPVGRRAGGHGRLPLPADPGRPAGRLPAHRPGVRDQLLVASVPGDAPRGQHVVRQVTGEEPGRARVVAGLVARHAEQGGRRGSSRSSVTSRSHSVVIPSAATHRPDAPVLAGTVAADPDDVFAGPGVEHPGDLDPGLPQVIDGRVADALAVSTTARWPGLTACSLMSRRTAVDSNHPGHVVAREDVGPLDQPWGDHQDLRARLDELLGSAR